MHPQRQRRDLRWQPGSGRLRRRELVRRAMALGCSASSLTGLLSACTGAGPAALGTSPVATATPVPVAATPGATAPSPTATAVPTTGQAVTPARTMARATATATAPADIVAWVRDQAIPFATAEPGDDDADLLPLERLVGDARVVALGEATHGTHEFFAMKHRLLAFLVRELGFNVFAIEASWPESNLVNDWVRTGRGDPARLLAGLYFWTWNTREVLDMIHWMRAHNAAPGAAPPVSFHGFDVQYPRLAIDNVLVYARQVDPPTLERFTAWYAAFRPYAGNRSGYAAAPETAKARIRADLQAAHDDLANHRATYESASSPAAFARALRGARVIVQAEEVFADPRRGAAARDRSMAENAAWLLDQAGPDAKIVLWAHNEHVGAVQAGSTPNAIVSMGAHLRERYGAEMVTFGFAFHRGACNAITRSGQGDRGTVAAIPVPPPPAGSYEDLFAQAGQPRMVLDLRANRPGPPVPAGLLGPRRFRSIGAVYDDARADDYFFEASLPRKFDAVIWFQDTSPSALLSLSSSPAAGAPQPDPPPFAGQPANLDFEAGLAGWSLAGSRPQDYEAGAARDVVRRGDASG